MEITMIAVVIWVLVVFLVVGVLMLIGIIFESENIKEPIKEQGRKARMNNLPANANPYIGVSSDSAVLWLEGYMEKKC